MIRFVKNQDYEGWKKLYLQYGEFYQVPMTHEGLSKVWTWLQDSSHEMEGWFTKRQAGSWVLPTSEGCLIP